MAETTQSDNKADTGNDQWNWPKWDYNWDKRDPAQLSGTDENNNKASKPRASRHLILVRHGQYNLDGETDTQRYLTDLGRSQASGTGARLAELGLPYTHIIRSNMRLGELVKNQIVQARCLEPGERTRLLCNQPDLIMTEQ